MEGGTFSPCKSLERYVRVNHHVHVNNVGLWLYVLVLLVQSEYLVSTLQFGSYFLLPNIDSTIIEVTLHDHAIPSSHPRTILLDRNLCEMQVVSRRSETEFRNFILSFCFYVIRKWKWEPG